MKITTNVFGPRVRLREEVILKSDSANIRDVLSALVEKEGEALKGIVENDLSPAKGCVVLVNGRNISSLQNVETRVHDGDEITLTVMMAGG